MKISPVIRLTLDPETRRIANIHERAVGVAFMHPMEIHEGVDMSQLTVAEQAALKNGAFAMFSFYAFNSNLCTQNFYLKKNSWYLTYPRPMNLFDDFSFPEIGVICDRFLRTKFSSEPLDQIGNVSGNLRVDLTLQTLHMRNG